MNIKLMIATSLLITSSISQAALINCELKTNIDEEAHTISVEETQLGHGSMVNFVTESFNGVIASSKGFLVVGITISATSQSMSFYGKPTDKEVGGQLINGEDWIQVSCKQ